MGTNLEESSAFIRRYSKITSAREAGGLFPHGGIARHAGGFIPPHASAEHAPGIGRTRKEGHPISIPDISPTGGAIQAPIAGMEGDRLGVKQNLERF